MANNKDLKLKLNFDLMRAAKSGNSNNIQLLLKAGADANTKDSCFRTALYHAALNGHVEVTKILVEHGAMLDTQDKCQRTPLYPASSRGYTEIVKCLLEHGAHVNATDKFKDTPLHLACGGGRKDVINLLIQKGANLESLNSFNEKPTDVAKCNGHHYVIAFIDNVLKQMGMPAEQSSPTIKEMLEQSVEGALISPPKKRKQSQVSPSKKIWETEKNSPNKKMQVTKENSSNKEMCETENTSQNKKEETSPTEKGKEQYIASPKKCECGLPFPPDVVLNNTYLAVPFMESSQSQCTDFVDLKYRIGSLGAKIEEQECNLKLLKLDRQKSNELGDSLLLRLKNVRKLRELRANDQTSRLKWTIKIEKMNKELEMTKENGTKLDGEIQMLENKINELKMERGKVYIEVDEFVTCKYQL